MNSFTLGHDFSERDYLIPRFREAGDIVLDFFHRDGRVCDRWIGLQPREFQLLWRLAEEPGQRVSRKTLLRDVWRIEFEPKTNSLAVHVARVRGKLSAFGLSDVLVTHTDGGYFLNVAIQTCAFNGD